VAAKPMAAARIPSFNLKPTATTDQPTPCIACITMHDQAQPSIVITNYNITTYLTSTVVPASQKNSMHCIFTPFHGDSQAASSSPWCPWCLGGPSLCRG
jgi:hypothetical protein